MTHHVNRNTLSPVHGPVVAPAAPRATATTKAIFSRAPASMGYGRPAQNKAGQE